jgi:hypothetical protein
MSSAAREMVKDLVLTRDECALLAWDDRTAADPLAAFHIACKIQSTSERPSYSRAPWNLSGQGNSP